MCYHKHHTPLSKNAMICSLTIVQWGGKEGKEDRNLYKKDNTCGGEFTDIKR